MPTGPGELRVTKAGARLHFTPSGQVNEAKNLATGKTHTPAELMADKKRKMAEQTKAADKRMSTYMNAMMRAATSVAR